jgi:hypothetical protein
MTTALIWAGTALAITGIVTYAALRGWRGWLELKRFEVAAERNGDAPDPTPGVRIEMADLKERLRRLEAIAQGVDL